MGIFSKIFGRKQKTIKKTVYENEDVYKQLEGLLNQSESTKKTKTKK